MGKVLPGKHEAQNSYPQDSHKRLGMAASMCNFSTDGGDTGGLWHILRPCLLTDLAQMVSSKINERISLKSKVEKRLRKIS